MIENEDITAVFLLAVDEWVIAWDSFSLVVEDFLAVAEGDSEVCYDEGA